MPYLHIHEDARFALARVDPPGAYVWDKVSTADQVGLRVLIGCAGVLGGVCGRVRGVCAFFVACSWRVRA